MVEVAVDCNAIVPLHLMIRVGSIQNVTIVVDQ